MFLMEMRTAMATTTFDKRIIIDDSAADVLIALLEKPAPSRPNTNGKIRELTEEDLQCYLQRRSTRLSAQSIDKVVDFYHINGFERLQLDKSDSYLQMVRRL